MPYKTGSWGTKARARAKKRNAYFYEYNKNRDPLKKRARQIVEYAVKRKYLLKGVCEVCGDSKTSAHHEDYEQPLKVKWLCKIHHRQADQEMR